MISRIFYTLTFMTLVLSVSLFGAGGKPQTDNTAALISIGQPAPDFTAIDSNGDPQTLSQYRGKTVVLEWKNHLCPFVVKHYISQNMQSLQQYAVENGIIWLSIISSAPGKQGYCTPQQANEISLNEQSFASSILLDSSGDIGRLYQAKTTPHMFVINKKGTLVYRGAIDSVRSSDPSDIPLATNYVKDALRSLLNKEPIAVTETAPYGCSVKY